VRDETLRDKLIREEQIDCRYLLAFRTSAASGVNYDQLTEDGKYVLPCKKNFVAITAIRPFAAVSRLGLLRRQLFMPTSDWSVVIARAAVAAAHEHADKQGFKKGKGGTGSMPCPTGCEELCVIRGGINGHMHAVAHE